MSQSTFNNKNFMGNRVNGDYYDLRTEDGDI